jgi:hypothetical protein
MEIEAEALYTCGATVTFKELGYLAFLDREVFFDRRAPDVGNCSFTFQRPLVRSFDLEFLLSFDKFCFNLTAKGSS